MDGMIGSGFGSGVFRIDNAANFGGRLLDRSTAAEGSVAANATGPGIAVAATGTDNNEFWVNLPGNPIRLSALGDRASIRARFALTEANVDDSNFSIGFTQTPAANLLLDNGGGYKASGDSIAVFKVDGGLAFQAIQQNGATRDVNVNVGTFASAAVFLLEIDAWVDGMGLNADIKINGVVAQSYRAKPVLGFDPVTAYAYIKVGGALAETLVVREFGIAYANSLGL